MKCPKCGYLGFESGARCRNCGYDFSLSPASSAGPGVELPIRSDVRSSFAEEAVTAPEDDLPLFGGAFSDDEPLITRASAPRTPLAVRRSTPDVPRLRTTPHRVMTPSLDLSSEPEPATPLVPVTPVMAPPVVAGSHPPAPARRKVPAPNLGLGTDASLAARLLAVIVDLAVLGGIDAVVVYFTMQICGIGVADLAMLPRVPLLAFFLVQNGGYLVVFTAGGQTLGKMLTGIKVVSTEPHSSLDLGCACLRELLWLALLAPAGLGLLTVFAGDHHRGIHDRLAGTRVVRA